MLLLALLAACHAPLPPHDTLPTAERLAGQGVVEWPAEDLPFDWIPTVWFYGLHRLHQASGDPGWQDPYRAWMLRALPDYDRETPREFHSSDSLSPATLAAVLMVEDSSVGLEPIAAAADAYLDEAPRTDSGAIEHWTDGAPLGGVPDQVWIDSLFMFGPYLQQRHAHTGDAAHLDRFTTQYAKFAELCRDPEADLYRHAWDDVAKQNIPTGETFWARGNSWVLVAAAEYVALVGPEQADPAVLEGLRAHAAAVAAAQDETGLWHTVLNEPRGDDPANYTETSASALLAYGLARGVKGGALDADAYLPAIARARRGLESRLDEQADGWLEVEGTSWGTNPGDYDYYVGVGTTDDFLLGIGAVVMFLAEVHGMGDPGAER